MSREPYSVRVLIPVRPSQKQLLDKAAEAMDETLSTFIRKACLDRIATIAQEEK